MKLPPILLIPVLATTVTLPVINRSSYPQTAPQKSADVVEFKNTEALQKAQLDELKKIVNFPVEPQLEQPSVPEEFKNKIKQAFQGFGAKANNTIDSLLKVDKGYAAFHDAQGTKLNMAILNNGDTVLIWTQPGGEAEKNFDGKGFVALLEKKRKFLRPDEITFTTATELPRSGPGRIAYMTKNGKFDAVGVVTSLLNKLEQSKKSPLLPKQFDSVKTLLTNFNEKSQNMQRFDVVYYPNERNFQSASLPQMDVETTLNEKGQRVLTLTYLLPEPDEKTFIGKQAILTYAQNEKNPQPLGPLEVKDLTIKIP